MKEIRTDFQIILSFSFYIIMDSMNSDDNKLKVHFSKFNIICQKYVCYGDNIFRYKHFHT